MQNSSSFKRLDALREKAAHCRCKGKLLNSIGEKVNKNAKTGNYGFTDPERVVLKELREWVKKMPDF